MMMAVPEALVGGVFFLWLTGHSYSVAVQVGFIACFGTRSATRSMISTCSRSGQRRVRPRFPGGNARCSVWWQPRCRPTPARSRTDVASSTSSSASSAFTISASSLMSVFVSCMQFVAGGTLRVLELVHARRRRSRAAGLGGRRSGAGRARRNAAGRVGVAGTPGSLDMAGNGLLDRRPTGRGAALRPSAGGFASRREAGQRAAHGRGGAQAGRFQYQFQLQARRRQRGRIFRRQPGVHVARADRATRSTQRVRAGDLDGRSDLYSLLHHGAMHQRSRFLQRIIAERRAVVVGFGRCRQGAAVGAGARW